MSIIDQLEKALNKSIIKSKLIYNSNNFNSLIEIAQNLKYGNYTSNIAFKMAKQNNINSFIIAKQIIKFLIIDINIINYIKIIKPGFINFSVKSISIQNILVKILKLKNNFGRYNKKNKNVLIEILSANPTGPLHFGHARCIFIADVLAKILKANGYNVIKEYYINDIGGQINSLAHSINKYYRIILKKSYKYNGIVYISKHIEEIAFFMYKKYSNKGLIISPDIWLVKCMHIGIKKNLNTIRSSLSKVGINIDSYFYESNLYNNKINYIINTYKNNKLLYISNIKYNKKLRSNSKALKFSILKEGGIFLKTLNFNDNENRIIIRKNRYPVYLIADIAYHKDKIERNFSKIINVFGADHSGHVEKLKAGLTIFNKKNKNKIFFILVQMVRFLQKGIEIKLSKRKENNYLFDNLIKQVGINGVRYMFLMRSHNSQITIDLKNIYNAKKENPIFYIQYSYMRIFSILQKIKIKYPFISEYNLLYFSKGFLKNLILPEELKLLQYITFYPNVISSILFSLEPHVILRYLHRIAIDFHSYFTKYKNSSKIISINKNLTLARISMLIGIKYIIRNTYELLGISTPSIMKIFNKNKI